MPLVGDLKTSFGFRFDQSTDGFLDLSLAVAHNRVFSYWSIFGLRDPKPTVDRLSWFPVDHGTVAQASMFASKLPTNSFLDGIDARKGRWRDGAAQAQGISHRELPMPISG